MHHPKLKEVLSGKIKSEQVEKIVDFLEQEGGFSPDGEMAMVSFFLFAQDAQKNFDEVLASCKKTYKSDWQYMHPEIRGNMKAPAPISAKNEYLLLKLHEELSIPLPTHST